jgi:hypothetical protein
MAMTAFKAPPSPTGRLTLTSPELQYFPGTKQAQAQLHRMKAACAQRSPGFLNQDYSALEKRLVQQGFGNSPM